MKKILAPKYQYYILPLTYVNICAIATLNYILWRDVSKAIKTLLLGFLVSVSCFLLVPYILESIGLSKVLQGTSLIIYFYGISTITGIYFIKEQQKYIDLRSS